VANKTREKRGIFYYYLGLSLSGFDNVGLVSWASLN
jgi:hypothetical protein